MKNEAKITEVICPRSYSKLELEHRLHRNLPSPYLRLSAPDPMVPIGAS